MRIDRSVCVRTRFKAVNWCASYKLYWSLGGTKFTVVSSWQSYFGIHRIKITFFILSSVTHRHPLLYVSELVLYQLQNKGVVFPAEMSINPCWTPQTKSTVNYGTRKSSTNSVIYKPKLRTIVIRTILPLVRKYRPCSSAKNSLFDNARR